MGLFSSREVPKGYGTPPGSPRQQMGVPPMWLQKANFDVRKPLTLKMPTQYGARNGEGHEEGMTVQRRPQNKSHLFFEKWRLNGTILLKAIICLLVPPLIFFWTTIFLSFQTHFTHPKRVWLIAWLAIIPVFFTAWATLRNYKMGLDVRWAVASTILFGVAFSGGMLLGDINYLLNMHHFYFLSSLKSYSNIKPAEVSGTQLMDAGRVQFAEGTKLMINMGMSFTMGDTYCVAPISASSSGPPLASYDLWAVGKNCCRSDNPTFACGEYQNIDARSGVRQTNEDERLYFALAVQQAEAAYNIEAAHPVFFHWVEDADATMQQYYSVGFRSWVFLIFSHMTMNALVVLLLMNILKYSNLALFKEPLVPGAYMLGYSPPGHGHTNLLPEPVH